ncbi:MAG: ImmA/IrrE family metallo-endopeptidase [Candidatus Omnitrophota bacterium]
MKIDLDKYLGSKPFLYGRKLLKDMGIKTHYVNERDVVDFLGYEIRTITPAEYIQFGDIIGEIFDDTCAVLLRQQSLILLSNSLPPRRERITLFHESGHDLLPWHHATAFSLRGKDIDSNTHKQIEREAFLAGTEIMYPLKHFIDDSRSIPLSLGSVNSLADRYNGSFEATCIRYALTNPNIMAIIVVKENEPVEKKITFHQPTSNSQLVFPNMPAFKRISPASTAPLRVQYSSHSHKFPKFIKSGTEIEQGNIIYDCWSQDRYKKGEIPASVFGSSAKFSYFAECVPFQDKVYVMLWLKDQQMYFGEEWN